MRLIYCSILILLSSCATKNMWVVSKHESGGIIAYQNYNGLSNDVWLEDIKQRIQCPDAFVMKEWERKSQIHQSSIILPMSNSYTTKTNSDYDVSNNYGMNLFNVSGNSTSTTTENTTQVIPYTEEVAWIEHRYECDWNKIAEEKNKLLKKEFQERYEKMSIDEKIEVKKSGCQSDDVMSCVELSILYGTVGKKMLRGLVLEKVCEMKSFQLSAAACHSRANDLSADPKSRLEAIKFYKKGCDLSSYGQKDEFAIDSCAYFAAHTKNRALLDSSIEYLKNRCALENNGDCYNLACLYSIAGSKEISFKYLRLALENGFSDWAHLESDADLINVRKMNEFRKLVDQFKERAPASIELKN